METCLQPSDRYQLFKQSDLYEVRRLEVRRKGEIGIYLLPTKKKLKLGIAVVFDISNHTEYSTLGEQHNDIVNSFPFREGGSFPKVESSIRYTELQFRIRSLAPMLNGGCLYFLGASKFERRGM